MTGQGKNRGNERRRELLGILIMAFALLIFLGLLSYHHSDYPNSGSPKVVKNWLGLIGAWFSYYLYVYTIGYSCLILPFLVFLLGWNIFLHREFKPFLRVCLYIFALGIFLSTALAMPETVSEERSKFGFRLSGLLGGFLAEQLNRYLGTVGSIVVLLTFLLLFFVSATSWSMRGTLLGFKEEMRAILQAVGKKKQRPKGQPFPRTNSDASIPIHRRGEEKLKEGRGIPKEPVPPPVVRVPAEKKIDAVKVPDRTSPKMGKYEFPPLELLTPALPEEKRVDQQALERKAYILEEKLRECLYIQQYELATRDLKMEPVIQV